MENWLPAEARRTKTLPFDPGRQSLRSPVSASRLNFTKPFTIIGILLAEAYLVALVLAPNTGNAPNVPLASALSLTSPAVFANLAPVLAGVPTPRSAQLWRIAAGSLFFVPFGAAAGMGAGLLVTGLAKKLRRSSSP
jgi:hypothetical protein